MRLTQGLQGSKQVASVVMSCRQGQQLKRKVLYVTEDTEDHMRGKMARMQIDEEASKVKS